MRTLILALSACALSAGLAGATDARLERTLRMLALPERLEQLCDYTAMTAIRKEQRTFRPDRTVASATAEPRVKGDAIVASGAAFRSRGKWYGLSYDCKADGEHMKVLSFSYKVGAEIPPDKWSTYNLYD